MQQNSTASRTVPKVKRPSDVGPKVEPMVDVGLVDCAGEVPLRKSGSGKITIESGAGESVCPIDMVPDEPLHKTSKHETKYRAAGGQSLINQGDKRIEFKAGRMIWQLSFQAIDEVKKPLVSAAKIANKGNMIVFDGDG